jgi:aspartokinase/homoserine dehydrogenase 1
MSRNAADLTELWETIAKYDNPAMDDRRIAAESKGYKLKYVATFEDGKAYTSIKEVGPDHPFYNIKGSGNIISFTTTRYKASNPLVITGPGAGADVTAAGVFADILRVMA